MPTAFLSLSLAVQFYAGFKGPVLKVFVFIMNTLNPNGFYGQKVRAFADTVFEGII